MNGLSVYPSDLGVLKGSRPVPLDPDEHPTSPRLCVMLRPAADPVEGWFFLLRDLPDARVYLGGLVDAGGRVREWLEIWIQNVEGCAAGPASCRRYENNLLLDQRWAKQCQSVRSLMPSSFWETGWESRHPWPSLIDLTSGATFHFKTGDPPERTQLCCDDALLQSAGLPAYSTSLFRYLYQPALGKASRFIPVVSDAPENTATLPLSEVLANLPSAAPLNLQGGLLMVTTYHPLALEDFADLLSEKPGLDLNTRHFSLGAPQPGPEEINRSRNLGPYLFLGNHGRPGRFLEAFHLKLQLLARTVDLVRGWVQISQLPLLNLSLESFRIRLGEFPQGLPWLWNSQCALVKPGQACPLPISTTEQRYFTFAGTPQPSIFQPEGLGNPVHGSGTVRIRKILPPSQERVVMEGTLVMPEPQYVSPRDLLWIRLPLLANRIDIYGHAYATEGLARGEIRFRTLPQKLTEAVVVALRAAEGVPFSRCAFEVAPMLSSPCDLHALGVLAVRILLVHEKTTLAVKLDEVLSLARQVSLQPQANVPLPKRLQSLFEQEAKWRSLLGPQHLSHQEITPEVAFQWIPPRLWFETLAALIRLFPGLGPDSFCRDLGDAPPLALDSIFIPALQAWQDLILRSRSLLMIDWNFNREIHSVIQSFKSGE